MSAPLLPQVPGVELAPRHKVGLSLQNPVLLAAGIAGYGDAVAPGIELERLGGFVTAAVSRRPWHDSVPMLRETGGGLLWQRGRWNPGVRRVVRDHAALWRRLAVAVIVHVVGDSPEDLAATAGTLEALSGVAGLELDVPAGAMADPAEAAASVWAVRDAADLPVLVRLALDTSDQVVQAVLDAGADALVAVQPPEGLHVDLAHGQRTRGGLHGPGLVPLIAAMVARLVASVDVPVVACGGVHSPADALAYLAAGATAVQVDTAAWIDPTLPARIVSLLMADG